MTMGHKIARVVAVLVLLCVILPAVLSLIYAIITGQVNTSNL